MHPSPNHKLLCDILCEVTWEDQILFNKLYMQISKVNSMLYDEIWEPTGRKFVDSIAKETSFITDKDFNFRYFSCVNFILKKYIRRGSNSNKKKIDPR